MRDLLGHKKTHLPILKTVVWWYQQYADWVLEGEMGPEYGAAECLSQLGQGFKEVGIKFNWVSTPYFRNTPFGRPFYA